MYKDKERQREADRARQRRYRAKAKGVTGKGVTVTPCVTSETLTPDGFVPVAVQLGYAKGERGYKVPLPGDKGFSGSVGRERAIVESRPAGVFTGLYQKQGGA